MGRASLILFFEGAKGKDAWLIFCPEEWDMKDWEASFFLKFLGTCNKGTHHEWGTMLIAIKVLEV
jgi:hypothetical protein